MGTHRTTQPRPRSRRRLGVLLAALTALVLGGGAYWWAAQPVVGGTPRLVLDREVIDFGNVPFATPVRAVFTLTNTGDGVLRLAGVPRVRVLAGC